jgi:hypothetical protein
MAWALLLLPELTRLVLVSLLLHRLVILFLETGSLTTLLLHDVYFSSLFFLGPCIPANHFVFTWDVQTLAIVYMTFVVFMDGFGFLLWLCVSGYVYGCMFMDVFGYVFGLCVWIPGLDPP